MLWIRLLIWKCIEHNKIIIFAVITAKTYKKKKVKIRY